MERTLTNLDHDFTEIVWMSTPFEEPNIADSSRLLTCLTVLEAILLDIAHGFQEEREYEDDDADDVCRLAELGLTIEGDTRAVENRHG